MKERLSRSAHKKAEYARQNFYAWMFVLIQAFAVLALLFLLVLSPVRVNGGSMSPTLLPGEVLLVDRFSLYLRMPQRGDMVIFSHPETGEELIKRVIALPGETVEIADGHVYVNGCLLDESAYSPALAEAYAPVAVPAGAVFVLGDDRGQSMDSRDPALGCIPLKNLDGMVRLRVSPLTRAALFV